MTQVPFVQANTKGSDIVDLAQAGVSSWSRDRGPAEAMFTISTFAFL